MATLPVKYWAGSITNCDICDSAIPKLTGSIFYDAATIHGPWAIMCPTCFEKNGQGVGTGVGQQYTFDPNGGRWLKTAG
jgi:hypothetical protein